MRLFVVIIGLLTIPFAGQSQELNKLVYDTSAAQEILIGYCDREGLRLCDEFFPHYLAEYFHYEPDIEILDKIKGNLDSLDITIVLATWCHDSREQVPRFLHVLDSLNFEQGKLTMIAVDRQKTTEKSDISELDIQRVPTFIFYRNENEIGRIIETPHKTLEWDFLRILMNEEQIY